MRILFCVCLVLTFPSFSACEEALQTGMCTENSCELKEKIGPEPVLNEEPLLRTPEEDRTDEMTKPAGLEKIKQTNKTPGNDPYDSWE